MRKDAEQNRQKLINAASEIMRSEGGDVPMELIAERAQLTRATLYRNFPHRQAMYMAVLQNDLATLTDHLNRAPGAEPLAFIRLMTELMMIYDKFLVSLAAMDDYDAETNEARMVDAIAAPLAAAKTAGLLDPRLTGCDILMACRMLASHIRMDGGTDLAEAFQRRLDLMLRGLGGAPASRPQPARTGKLVSLPDRLDARTPSRRARPDTTAPHRPARTD